MLEVWYAIEFVPSSCQIRGIRAIRGPPPSVSDHRELGEPGAVQLVCDLSGLLFTIADPAFAHGLDEIALGEFSSTASFHGAVHLDLSVLNQVLGLSSRARDAAQFEELVQANRIIVGFVDIFRLLRTIHFYRSQNCVGSTQAISPGDGLEVRRTFICGCDKALGLALFWQLLDLEINSLDSARERELTELAVFGRHGGD